MLRAGIKAQKPCMPVGATHPAVMRGVLILRKSTGRKSTGGRARDKDDNDNDGEEGVDRVG
jgi:hypothetical protein